MDVGSFFARALQEGERYGEDPYVFLRELAQNARDSGAGRIDVRVVEKNGHQFVGFDDDGCGMSLEHARAYLFRLYASSKENDPSSAGHFGVGFWSVLRWLPNEVVVESRVEHRAWSVRLDQELGAESGASTLRHRGTRVTLRRVAVDDEVPLVERVKERLRYYCRHLRTNGRRPKRLPVYVNGERVDEPMTLPGPVSLRFETAGAQGVVGLGEEPRVELYARGLLVKRATVLEEIDPEAEVPPQHQSVGGLAPVVLLNSDTLEVVMSRQEPVESKALAKLVSLARKRVQRLVDQVADRACPLPWWVRAWDGTAGAVRSMGGPVAIGVVGLWAAAAAMLTWLVLGLPMPGLADLPAPIIGTVELPAMHADGAKKNKRRRTYSNVRGYQGPRVDVPASGGQRWGLSYRGGPSQLFFKTLTLSDYDRRKGWVRGDSNVTGPYPQYRCRKRCIEVTLAAEGADEPLVLPLPTGYLLERQSLRFNEKAVFSVSTNDVGEALVSLPGGESGTLVYRAGWTLTEIGVHLPRPPDIALPADVNARLRRLRTRSAKRRTQGLARWVESEIAYDVSPTTAVAFGAHSGHWLERVLELGAGDCDVKNGVNVLLLQHLEIPARLAVGIPARHGRAEAGLHAWTEYYLQGWHPIDVSGSAPVLPPIVTSARAAGPGSGRTAASPSQPSAPRVRRTSQPAAAGGPILTAPPARASGGAAGARMETPPRPASAPETAVGWQPFAGASLVLLMLLAVVVSAWRRRGAERYQGSVGGEVEKRALARMLRDALTYPSTWRSATNLWHRRVLPTVRGRPMSVAEAARRSLEGRLWMTRRRSRLAKEAVRAGRPILDGSDPIFGPVISALGRAVDLDAFDSLRPTRAEDDAAIVALCQRANRLLSDAGVAVSCAPVIGMHSGELRDVDLSALKLRDSAGWPRRYIALSVQSEIIKDWATLLQADPDRGGFLWLDWLLDRSDLLADRAERIRERSAQAFLRTMQ